MLAQSHAVNLDGGGHLFARVEDRRHLEGYGYRVSPEHLDQFVKLLKEAFGSSARGDGSEASAGATTGEPADLDVDRAPCALTREEPGSRFEAGVPEELCSEDGGLVRAGARGEMRFVGSEAHGDEVHTGIGAGDRLAAGEDGDELDPLREDRVMGEAGGAEADAGAVVGGEVGHESLPARALGTEDELRSGDEGAKGDALAPSGELTYVASEGLASAPGSTETATSDLTAVEAGAGETRERGAERSSIGKREERAASVAPSDAAGERETSAPGQLLGANGHQHRDIASLGRTDERREPAPPDEHGPEGTGGDESGSSVATWTSVRSQGEPYQLPEIGEELVGQARPVISIRCFGRARVTCGDRELSPVSKLGNHPQAWEILLFLAANPVGVSKDKLMSAIWPQDDPSELTGPLRSALNRVRESLNYQVSGLGSKLVGTKRDGTWE